MKTTVVPAQITTVEDKIAGSLSLSQLLLLAAPIFGGSVFYIVFPPTLRLDPYKIVLIAVMLLCGLMAIRVKGKILLLWLITIGRYNLRPRYYLASKNDQHLRPLEKDMSEATDEQEEGETQESPVLLPQLSTADIVTLEQLMTNPQTNLTFKPAKKGGLSVVITEVE